MEKAVSSDARLIERLKRREEGAFSELYTKYYKKVFSLCLRMMGNRADAEDKTQETFLNVFRFIDGFKGKSALSTWIHRIATNQVGMSRRRKTIDVVSLEISSSSSEDENLMRQIPVCDKVLTGSVNRITLEVIIRKLPPGYRSVLILHDVEGFQHNEIAAMSGGTTGNSKSQLNRARKRARALIEEPVGAKPAKKKSRKKT